MRDPDFFLAKYAPVTAHLAFIEAPATTCANSLLARANEVATLWNLPWTPTYRQIAGPLDSKLAALLPLPSGRHSKTLVSSTSSSWSAYIPNAYKGGDAHTEPKLLAQALQTRAVITVLADGRTPHDPVSFQFVVHDFRDGVANSRIVYLHKESKWEFRQSGHALPFENVKIYDSPKVRDRFSVDLVEAYCCALGITLFDPDFYWGDGFVIQSYLPPGTELHDSFPAGRSA